MKATIPKLAAAMVACCLAASAVAIETDSSTLTKVGDVSPVLSVQTIDGQAIDFHGKVVVLNFFATWCGPCQAEMPNLEKGLWQPLRDKGLVLVSVGREHSVAEVSDFQKKKGFSFLFAADPKREVYAKFATKYIPRCILIGKDGRIKFQSVGYSDQEFSDFIAAAKEELAK